MFCAVVCLWVTLLYKVHLCVHCWVFERVQVEIRSSWCGVMLRHVVPLLSCLCCQTCEQVHVLAVPLTVRESGPGTVYLAVRTRHCVCAVRTRHCASCITGPAAKTKCKISFSPTEMFWTCILEVLCSNTVQGTCRRDWKVWYYLAVTKTFVSGCYYEWIEIRCCVCVWCVWCVCGCVVRLQKFWKPVDYFYTSHCSLRGLERLLLVTTVLRRPDTGYAERKRYMIIVKLM